MTRRIAAFTVSAAVLLAGAYSIRGQNAAAGKGIWGGVYNEEQARRGLEKYTDSCSGCHKADLLGFDDSDGFAAQLKGEMFMDHWLEDNLQALFTRMKTSMPQDAPGSLSDDDYRDILTYVLKENDLPAGSGELKQTELAGIKITGKEGEGPVPDGGLVEVNGCLLQSRQKAWIVYKASDAVRTRETNRPSEAALKAAEDAPAGSHTFRLTGADFLRLQNRLGHKVVVRGFVTWKANDDQLSVVSIEQAGSGRCQ
jgi:mono/diheme cytochrome c family protein